MNIEQLSHRSKCRINNLGEVWVPQVDFNKSWTDRELFAFFNLTKEEQRHIQEKVREWS